MISSLSVPICKCFYARLASGKITTFRGYPSLMPACAGFLEPVGSRRGLLKYAFNAKVFYRQVVLVCLQPLRRNSRLKCALQPKIAESLLKTSFGGSRSFKVIDVNKCKKPVASACYDKQHVCTYLQPLSRYTSR